MNIRLQIGVAVTFTALMVIVIAATVGFLYVSQKKLAIETADSAMSDARAKSILALFNYIRPIGRIVDTTASYVAALPERAPNFEEMAVLDTQIRELPQVYSLYFGLENGGEFYQVARLPDALKTFGPSGTPVPKGTELVLRSIDSEAGVKRARYVFQSEWGSITGVKTGPVDYDPRTRPWYAGARDTDRLVVSPIYIFSSTGRPGLTFSRRMLEPTGQLLGVVGADLTLDRLTEILNDVRIGADGLSFLLDREGRPIAHSGKRGHNAGADLALAHGPGGPAAEDPVMAAAIDTWKSSGAERFDFSVPGSDTTYLASIAPLPSIYGVRPTFGLVVPEREFVGAIDRSTERVLQLGAAIVLVSVVVTYLLARLLSRQIQRVAAEARRISDFDLEGDFDLRSHLLEVGELGSAVAKMKNSLRSFGAYVPTDLVRSIMSSGGSVAVGGAARDISIMFSDIEDFTAKSEDLPPEFLMTDLSRYFEEMESTIARHNGTVDKYVGDSIMAIWNAPAEDSDHVVNACRALLACRAAGERLNAEAAGSHLLPVHTRFGLHADRVVVGNVGSESRLQYTAIGAAVNLASRTEALNKGYGTQMLVTQNIVDRAGDLFVFRPVDLVSPAGTTHPIMIHELVGEAGVDAEFPVSDAARREIDDWKACYRLYLSRAWADALTAFKAHRALSSRKKLVAVYVGRCTQFVERPPPENWNGVQHLDTK